MLDPKTYRKIELELAPLINQARDSAEPNNLGEFVNIATINLDELYRLLIDHLAEKTPTVRQKRDRALSDMASIIEELWGARCSVHEAGCYCCLAWVMFDALVKLTDSSEFDT